jgi:hypothetical protein
MKMGISLVKRPSDDGLLFLGCVLVSVICVNDNFIGLRVGTTTT